MATTDAEPVVRQRLVLFKDAAAMLGTSETGIRRLVEQGKLRTVRLNPQGWRRIAVEEIERLIEEGASP